MTNLQMNRAWLAAVLASGLLVAGAAHAAVTIDSLSIEVGGDTSAIESIDVRDEDESAEEVTEVSPLIVREVTLTSTAPGGATATAETTLNLTVLAGEDGVQVGADLSLAGTATSCDECEDVLSNAAARPAVRFLMVVTVTASPVEVDWTGNAVSVLPPNPPFTVTGDAELSFEVSSTSDGIETFAFLECHSNEFANPVFPCPTEASTTAVLDPGTYLVRCSASLAAASLDSLADPATPVEASSEVDWLFTLGEVTPAEGSLEGVLEGQEEGAQEGEPEGVAEGEGEADGEGSAEGEGEGATEGEGEGALEGEGEGYAEGEGEGDPDDPLGCAYLPSACNGGNPTKALGDCLLGIGMLVALGLCHLWMARAAR